MTYYVLSNAFQYDHHSGEVIILYDRWRHCLMAFSTACLDREIVSSKDTCVVFIVIPVNPMIVPYYVI